MSKSYSRNMLKRKPYMDGIVGFDSENKDSVTLDFLNRPAFPGGPTMGEMRRNIFLDFIGDGFVYAYPEEKRVRYEIKPKFSFEPHLIWRKGD